MAIIRDPKTGNYFNSETGVPVAAGMEGAEGHRALLKALEAAGQVGVPEVEDFRTSFTRPSATALAQQIASPASVARAATETGWTAGFDPSAGVTVSGQPAEHVGPRYIDEPGGVPYTARGPYQEWGSSHIGTDPNVLYEVVEYTHPTKATYWNRRPVSNKTVEKTRAVIRESVETQVAALAKSPGPKNGDDPQDEDKPKNGNGGPPAKPKGGQQGQGPSDPMFEIAGGYYNDLLELQALELQAQTQLQRDAQALQRELGYAGFDVDYGAQQVQREAQQMQRDLAAEQAGLGVLDLAMRNRGPENAIQYSNLARGLGEGQLDYPAVLRRVAGLRNAGARTPNPFLGMVDLNRLPDEAVGGTPGILRAYNPYQVSLQELNRLSDYDFDLLVNSLESAGGDPSMYAATLEQLMPGRGAATSGRFF